MVEEVMLWSMQGRGGVRLALMMRRSTGEYMLEAIVQLNCHDQLRVGDGSTERLSWEMQSLNEEP